jgi:hypothetical protein
MSLLLLAGPGRAVAKSFSLSRWHLARLAVSHIRAIRQQL